MSVKNIFCLVVILFLSHTKSFSQNDNGYDIKAPDYKYGKFYNVRSELMQREFPILVFTPADYTKNKTAWPVVYMLHGVNNMPLNEDGLRKIYNPGTRMQEMADMFKVIIVAPLVGVTFYLDAPLKPEVKVASFISKELTAYIDSNFKTENNRNGRILCGFSMGGYGAVSLLCRYPDTFSVALEKAGLLDPATTIEDLKWDNTGFGMNEYLGNYFENRENYHLNSCFNLVNHIRDRKDIGIVMSVGKEDFLYKTNNKFHLWLNELKVPHIYTEYEGGHKWDANSLHNLLSNLQHFKVTQF